MRTDCKIASFSSHADARVYAPPCCVIERATYSSSALVDVIRLDFWRSSSWNFDIALRFGDYGNTASSSSYGLVSVSGLPPPPLYPAPAVFFFRISFSPVRPERLSGGTPSPFIHERLAPVITAMEIAFCPSLRKVFLRHVVACIE